jgi:glycerol uptake facilitator-like aquaporin
MIDAVALIAEFLGTFLLVLAVFASGGNALAIGAALALIVAMIGKISGAHVNPAISTAMYMKGSLSLNELLAYVAVQVAGAVSSLYTYRVFA